MDFEAPSFVISALKKDLEDKERNLILAAQIGKDLLEQNAELNVKWEESVKESGLKIEDLKQEIYTSTLKLGTKESVIRNAHAELDQQEKFHHNEIERLRHTHHESFEKLNKKISSQENMIESLQNEVHFNTLQIEELHRALHESYDKLKRDSSLPPEGPEEESSQHQVELIQLTNEKQALEKEMNSLTFQFKTCQHQLEKARTSQQSLKVELEEKECELTTLFNTLQKSKDENEELQVEIDNMKLQETDPTRKGNSIFAELEDNRKCLEQSLLSLREKFEVSKKQCEIKTRQISQMKLQMASLLLLNKTEMDQGYINHLEESLYDGQKQLKEYASKCQELETLLQVKTKDQEDTYKEVSVTKEGGTNNFFKVLYHQSRNKISDLEAEMESLRFNKISLSDQLHQMKRKAYIMEKERDSLNGKLIQLKVKLEELQGDQLEKEQERHKPIKKKTEVLPFFKEPKLNLKDDLKKMKAFEPLKDNLIRLGIPFATEDKTSRITLENKENRVSFPPSCTGQEIKEKRAKKTVKLTETVKVFDDDSKVTELELKERDGGDRPKRIPKSLRRVEIQHINAAECLPPDECTQQ